MTQAIIKRFESSVLTNKFNDVSNLNHPNPTTFFSSNAGVGRAFIEARFEEETDINVIALSFMRGKERRTCVAVLYIDSKEVYKKVEPSTLFVSSGETDNTQNFIFKKVKAKGVRLVFYGNADNDLFDQFGNVKDPKAINSNLTVIGPQGQRINSLNTTAADLGPNKQIFAVRKLSILYREDLERTEKLDVEGKKEKEEGEEEVRDKEEEFKCEICESCGNSDKSKIKDGVCQSCKNLCHLGHNQLKKEFPFVYNLTSNQFQFNRDLGVGCLQRDINRVMSTTTNVSNDDDDDRGIKSKSAQVRLSGSYQGGASTAEGGQKPTNVVYRVKGGNNNPLTREIGHPDHLTHRDNYTNMSNSTNLSIPQERPQIQFTNSQDGINRMGLVGQQPGSASGERLDRVDLTRNVISSITPKIYVPTKEEEAQIISNRQKTDAQRGASTKPNGGDLNNINIRDINKEIEEFNKKLLPATNNNNSNNNNGKSSFSSQQNNKPKIEQTTPSPIIKGKEEEEDKKDNKTVKDSELKNNDNKSKVKISKEQEVEEEKLDPDIAKTFDDFLNDNKEVVMDEENNDSRIEKEFDEEKDSKDKKENIPTTTTTATTTKLKEPSLNLKAPGKEEQQSDDIIEDEKEDDDDDETKSSSIGNTVTGDNKKGSKNNKKSSSSSSTTTKSNK